MLTPMNEENQTKSSYIWGEADFRAASVKVSNCLRILSNKRLSEEELSPPPQKKTSGAILGACHSLFPAEYSSLQGTCGVELYSYLLFIAVFIYCLSQKTQDVILYRTQCLCNIIVLALCHQRPCGGARTLRLTLAVASAREHCQRADLAPAKLSWRKGGSGGGGRAG